MDCPFVEIASFTCHNHVTTSGFLPQFQRQERDLIEQIDLGTAAGRPALGREEPEEAQGYPIHHQRPVATNQFQHRRRSGRMTTAYLYKEPTLRSRIDRLRQDEAEARRILESLRTRTEESSPVLLPAKDRRVRELVKSTPRPITPPTTRTSVPAPAGAGLSWPCPTTWTGLPWKHGCSSAASDGRMGPRLPDGLARVGRQLGLGA